MGLNINISHIAKLCDFNLNGSHWYETLSVRNCRQEPVEHFLWLPLGSFNIPHVFNQFFFPLKHLHMTKTSIFHRTRNIFYSARSHSCR